MGAVLKTLHNDGLLDEALVFLTSDHGERLGEQHPVPGRRRHLGNPAFDYLLQVPLIVAPRILDDPGRLIRGQDLASLVLEQAGASLPDPPELAEEETFFSEWEWQTLRTPRWKAMFPRAEGRALLFDLDRDPAEQTDVAAVHPEIVATMRARASELTDLLAMCGRGVMRASEGDLERLRAIGYIEAAEQAAASDTVSYPNPKKNRVKWKAHKLRKAFRRGRFDVRTTNQRSTTERPSPVRLLDASETRGMSGRVLI